MKRRDIPKITKDQFHKLMIQKMNLPPDNPMVTEGLNNIWIKMFDNEFAQALFENRYQSHLHEYICIGPQTWGRGDTPDEAFKNALKQWPKEMFSRKLVMRKGSTHQRPKIYVDCSVYRCPKGSMVDDLGSIVFPPQTCRCDDCREVGVPREKEDESE